MSKVIGNVPLTVKLRTGTKVTVNFSVSVVLNFVLNDTQFNFIYLNTRNEYIVTDFE